MHQSFYNTILSEYYIHSRLSIIRAASVRSSEFRTYKVACICNRVIVLVIL